MNQHQLEDIFSHTNEIVNRTDKLSFSIWNFPSHCLCAFVVCSINKSHWNGKGMTDREIKRRAREDSSLWGTRRRRRRKITQYAPLELSALENLIEKAQDRFQCEELCY